MNIGKKLNAIETLQDEIDTEVWGIFSRYIKATGIHFNSPDRWSVGHQDVVFEGYDGCMGCFDHTVEEIPFKFFTDPEESFKQLAIEMEEKAAARRTDDENRKRKADLEKLAELKSKYPEAS